jgi:hypothetical protein
MSFFFLCIKSRVACRRCVHAVFLTLPLPCITLSVAVNESFVFLMGTKNDVRAIIVDAFRKSDGCYIFGTSNLSTCMYSVRHRNGRLLEQFFFSGTADVGVRGVFAQGWRSP